MGPGVDDTLHRMVRECVLTPGAAAEGELQDPHPGVPELLPQPVHRRRDHTEVLDDEGQVPELPLDDLEELPAGTATPPPTLRRRLVRPDRPVGDEAAEMVDPGHVHELEGATEALDPPAVSLGAAHRPAVERVPPELPVRVQEVRRRSRDLGPVEQLSVGDDICSVTSNVDREIADDPDAAVGGVRPQRAPLALEPDLIHGGARTREALPIADPVPVTRAETLDLGRHHLGGGLCKQAAPGCERRDGVVGRPEAVGRHEREDLPPALPRRGEPVHEPLCLDAEPAARQRGGMEEDTGGALQLEPGACSIAHHQATVLNGVAAPGQEVFA